MPAPRAQYSSATLQIKQTDFPDERTYRGLYNLAQQLRQFFAKVVLVLNAEVTDFGTTAQRPTLPGNLHPGSSYFDTTLGKPIWVNAAGTGWVDATGAAV